MKNAKLVFVMFPVQPLFPRTQFRDAPKRLKSNFNYRFGKLKYGIIQA